MEALTPNAVLAVDAVVFTVLEGRVRVALAPGSTNVAEGSWALPGVLLRASEGVEEGLSRMASEKLRGHVADRFRPFGFSGEPNRDPRGRVASLFHAGFLRRREVPALEAGTAYRLCPVEVAGDQVAVTVDGQGVCLAYDHAEILKAAVCWLRIQLPRGTVTAGLLGDLFTLQDLKEVYEAVYAVTIPQSAFDYAVRSKKLAEPTGLRSEGGYGRPSIMHRAPTSLPLHWEPTQ